MEFVYRKKKCKYRYHIKTDKGTACRMENSTCFVKLDTISHIAPEGRKLCQMCDHVYNNRPIIKDIINNRLPWEREALWD